ncbi:MAG: DUF11 domain-containing protein [Gemmataceae bacterium]|nr:DUF11 domain-containing protein [Gemmataceae bacterium]
MTARQRSLFVALLLSVVSVEAAMVLHWGHVSWAGSRPVTARTAQQVTPEPPLAGAPLPVPAPPAEPPAPAGSANPADPPTPVVKLRVRVPVTVGAGAEIEYRICVENCSQADAHHVVVRNPLPANAQFVRATPEPSSREPEITWQLGTLAACSCKELVLVLTPTGAGDVTSCARVQFEHGQCVTTRIARPNLTVRKCGPAQAVLYDNLSFQIEVRNTGGAPATGVVVTDTLPDGLEHSGGKNVLTWDLGTLAPGASKCLEYQAIAKKAGRLCNTAVVTATGGARAESESCVVIGEARLELEKRGPDRRFVTRPATYAITVHNPGTSPATNVVITDLVPAGAAVVSIGEGGRQVGANQVQWALGTLPPGARRTVQIVLGMKEPGEIVNRATAAADRGLTAQAEIKTLFEGATGLTADVDVKDNPLEVGAETRYVITVINQGAIQATKVQVIATVPEQLAIVSARGPSNHQVAGQQVIFEALPAIQSRTEVKYEIVVKALRPGDVRFKIDVSADQLPTGPVHREQSTTIYADAPPPPPATRLEPPQAIPQRQLK